MADDLLKFDFGFTAVDESELEAVQQISTKASSTEAEVKVLEDKLNNLYNAILPLLSNLKKNPEKEYILFLDSFLSLKVKVKLHYKDY